MAERFGLSAGRWVAVNAFIASVVGLQLFDVARRGEHWPFAQYAMHASEHGGGDITWYRVYGVSAAGEFPLDRDAYYSPLDGQRLSFSFAPRPASRGAARGGVRGDGVARGAGPRVVGSRSWE